MVLRGGVGFSVGGIYRRARVPCRGPKQMSKKKLRFYGRFINSTNAGEEGEDNGTGEDIVLSKISTGFFSS